jgi:hypothetical protein
MNKKGGFLTEQTGNMVWVLIIGFIVMLLIFGVIFLAMTKGIINFDFW